MKRLIKSIVVFCLIGIIGLGNTYASTEDCLSNDCLSALLKSDLLGANSDEVFKYFDDFPEQAFKSWKSMKDFPGVRIDLDHLQTLSKVSDRFTFANKTGYEGLTELFKIAKTSNVDAVLEGLKKADEIFDTSLPVIIGAKKSGSQIFANVTDGDGNLVCRIVGGKLSKKQIIPDGTKVGKYDGLDIVQSGNRVGFLEEVNWATTGDLYKDAKLGAEIGGGAGANKKVFVIDDGNNDKVIALLREGKNVNVLNSEVEALQQLSNRGFPVVEIIEKTVHINPTTKIGTPAIVMKKYAKGSEQIVDVFGDEIKIIADADALKVVTDKSIDDLNAIKQMMIDKNVSIDDLQFLIGSDGRFVIADPVGANFASTPSKVNLDLIDELINQVRKVVGSTSSTGVKLIDKIDDSYASLKGWIGSLDDVTDANLLNKLDEIGSDYWKLLDKDLLSASNGSELRGLLKTAEDIDAWKLLKENPAYAFEISKNGGSLWTKWSKANFFKVVTKKGKDFEALITGLIKTKEPFKTLFQNGYKHLTQIYIKGTSKVVIADDLFVTKQFDEILEIDYFRAVINDSKLSKGSPWTPNQKSELIDVFKNNPNKKYIKFEVRSTKGELNKFDLPDESFVQGVEIRIYREDVFKIISDGNDSFGEVLDMNKLNFK
ncbi:hypothetical protein [Aquimarina algiphila]|uniref:hypothetical protein n=1 Tax=Aquimarina algiphila TaxID=2047982 RepID=UPI00232AB52C|nr:hypothetical protein [Aquimarina algiphila]